MFAHVFPRNVGYAGSDVCQRVSDILGQVKNLSANKDRKLLEHGTDPVSADGKGVTSPGEALVRAAPCGKRSKFSIDLSPSAGKTEENSEIFIDQSMPEIRCEQKNTLRLLSPASILPTLFLCQNEIFHR